MKCTEGVISTAQKGTSKRRAKPPAPTGTGVFCIAGGQDMNPRADAQHGPSLQRCREWRMGKGLLKKKTVLSPAWSIYISRLRRPEITQEVDNGSNQHNEDRFSKETGLGYWSPEASVGCCHTSPFPDDPWSVWTCPVTFTSLHSWNSPSEYYCWSLSLGNFCLLSSLSPGATKKSQFSHYLLTQYNSSLNTNIEQLVQVATHSLKTRPGWQASLIHFFNYKTKYH